VIIEGSFTIEQANELVNLLNGGALPAPLKVEERRTVTAPNWAPTRSRPAQLSTMIGFTIIWCSCCWPTASCSAASR
jgi:preprotein translocase subunit SecD